MPRNWIVLAAFTRNAPSWLSLNLHCTYPDMRGVTVENLEIFKKGPREAREDWSKAVITIERARGDWSSRKTRIPDRYGIEIDEREARNTHFAKDRKTVWFNGDGSRIIAYDDYGGIIGWDDVLEIGGAFYLLRYGPTLVEHWRDIRTRANQTMASCAQAPAV